MQGDFTVLDVVFDVGAGFDVGTEFGGELLGFVGATAVTEMHSGTPSEEIERAACPTGQDQVFKVIWVSSTQVGVPPADTPAITFPAGHCKETQSGSPDGFIPEYICPVGQLGIVVEMQSTIL